MRDWWEENIHYTEYDSETIYGWHDMVDTYVVAEVAIYSADGTPRIGLYFVFTGQDAMIRGVTKDAAIEEAKRVRPKIVQEWHPRVGKQKETIQVLYKWNGQYVGQRVATA